MSDDPFVTVLIPMRNEASDIGRCLEHVLAQDHPPDRMEIVMVDGQSEDETVELAHAALAESTISYVVIQNPARTTPSSLNLGLEAAVGDVICRVDARSFVPPNYVRTCSDLLSGRPDLAVVGGAQVATAAGGRAAERGIARALNNRLVMGGARYRSGADSGPDETVYLGAFRATELRSEGGWNEALPTNQDFDLNRRMARFGTVWFDSTIPVRYRPRPDLGALARQYHRFGRAKVEYWQRAGDRPLARQRRILYGATAAFVAGAGAVVAARRRGRVLAAMTLCGGILTLAVDELGSRETATASERFHAALAVIVVGGGWLSGVVRATVDRARVS